MFKMAKLRCLNLSQWSKLNTDIKWTLSQFSRLCKYMNKNKGHKENSHCFVVIVEIKQFVKWSMLLQQDLLTRYCNLQGHSSWTPTYLYSHKMNFGIHYETDIAIYKDTVLGCLHICTVTKWTLTSTMRLTLHSTRTQFLDPHIFVQSQNELWCMECNTLIPSYNLEVSVVVE